MFELLCVIKSIDLSLSENIQGETILHIQSRETVLQMLVIELHSSCPARFVLSALARMRVKVVWRTMLFTLPDWGLRERDRNRDTLGWPTSTNPEATEDYVASRLPSNFPRIPTNWTV